MTNIRRRILTLVLCVCMCASLAIPTVFADNTEYATREYVVSEFVQSVGRGSLTESESVLEFFDDAHKVSEEYKEDVSRAIVAGILKGYSDHTLRPDEPITRVEALVMLSRCLPNLPETEEETVFTDVPDWAKKNISYLSKAGLVKGYGNGLVGSDDYITIEQVEILVSRCDDILGLLSPGDSFYGYVNEKAFRNAILENATEIDPVHGAVVEKQDSWSYFADIYDHITSSELEALYKLEDKELPMEKGSVEQRIYDMLECIDTNIAISDSDKTNIANMRNAIVETKSLDELIKVTEEIYKLSGINVLFDINISFDDETGIVYPSFSVANFGDAGFIEYIKPANGNEYKEVYIDLMSEYLEASGIEFTDKDIDKAFDVQVKSSEDKDYSNFIIATVSLAKSFGIYTEEEAAAIVESLKKDHSEFYNPETDSFINPFFTFETKNREDADKTFTGFDLCQELADYGFTNIEKIIVPVGGIAKAEKDLICEENLNALKLNAIIRLGTTLGVSLNTEEENAVRRLISFPTLLIFTKNIDDLKLAYEQDAQSNEESIEIIEISTGVELDDGLVNATNLNSLKTLMPNDIGLLYCKYYYDDKVSSDIEQMFYDIWDAYEERFKNNTWMNEETKKNAIKKLDNMLAVVAYPDNYTFPEITPVSEGGTLFSNVLSIKRHELSVMIRANEDKEFIRTMMYLPPDEVNACYIPNLNTINVPAGILNYPFYDKDASYATNLGGIGMVIAHEIGHAFDSTGALYDENGCEKNWWTEKDYEEFKKLQDYFVEYYSRFEVTPDVIQDSSITLGENMADFAAMQIIMDVIGDDKQAQQECLERYATIWAKLGTVSYLTNNTLMSDVHSSSGVRVNAVVASFQQFYDIYGITPEDPMYVPAEERLKLW